MMALTSTVYCFVWAKTGYKGLVVEVSLSIDCESCRLDPKLAKRALKTPQSRDAPGTILR